MPRHIIDQPRPQDDAELARFVDIARKAGEEGSHPSAKELHRRPTRKAKKRVVEYARIDRGREV